MLKGLINASVNTTCAQPPPPLPGLLRSICPPCHSRGWGICKFCTARGPGVCQPWDHFWAFDTNAVSYQNRTTQKVLLEKTQIGSSVKDRNKLKRVVKACSRLCMHFFIALSQDYIAKLELSMWINVFGYWIKFLLILFEEHSFILIKLFITYNLTALC